MPESLSIRDVPRYLDTATFGIQGWLEGNNPSDQILIRCMQYTQVLMLSDPAVRREYRIRAVAFPKFDAPYAYFTHIAKTRDRQYPRPDETLLLDSHLFLPYVFPHVLKTLNRADMLTDKGLKSLLFHALTNNNDAHINPVQVQKHNTHTPVGIFENRDEANYFLRFLADSMRESLGKTPSTYHLTIDGNPVSYYLKCITADTKEQDRIITDICHWLRPRPTPDLEEAKSLHAEHVISEEPAAYVSRMKQIERFKLLIVEGFNRD